MHRGRELHVREARKHRTPRLRVGPESSHVLRHKRMGHFRVWYGMRQLHLYIARLAVTRVLGRSFALGESRLREH